MKTHNIFLCGEIKNLSILFSEKINLAAVWNMVLHLYLTW